MSSAGAARAFDTRHALAERDVPAARVWVATTDADTVVPEDWLRNQLAVADGEFIAVAGVVDLESGSVEVAALSESFRSRRGLA